VAKLGLGLEDRVWGSSKALMPGWLVGNMMK
jgi:hypothetical protein